MHANQVHQLPSMSSHLTQPLVGYHSLGNVGGLHDCLMITKVGNVADQTYIGTCIKTTGAGSAVVNPM